ncbi:14711_t:CDS:2, partial [Cetraspora pellucida]
INQLSTRDRATYNDNCQWKHYQDVDDDKKKMSTKEATILAKKYKTKSEKRTRSRRLIVLNYRELLTGTDVGTFIKKIIYTDKNPSQENEKEAMTENSFKKITSKEMI